MKSDSNLECAAMPSSSVCRIPNIIKPQRGVRNLVVTDSTAPQPASRWLGSPLSHRGGPLSSAIPWREEFICFEAPVGGNKNRTSLVLSNDWATGREYSNHRTAFVQVGVRRVSQTPQTDSQDHVICLSCRVAL